MASSTAELDWAWACGLFEGEGYISTSTDSKHSGWRWLLVLSSTDKDVVDKFHRIVGFGRIKFEAGRKDTHKDSWRWLCSRRDEVNQLLEKMLPFLGERRSAAAELTLSKPFIKNGTHCRNGHERTPENLYAGGTCKICMSEYNKRKRGSKVNV